MLNCPLGAGKMQCLRLVYEYVLLEVYRGSSESNPISRSDVCECNNDLTTYQSRSTVFLDRPSCVNVSQDRFYWPDKAFLHTVCSSLIDRDKVLSKGHTDVGANTREDVPPAMQLEEEAPG